MPGETGANTWLSLLWVLICVVVILALAYWFTRHIAARGLPGLQNRNESEQFQVLARLALGREQYLALVRAGTRYFLLGIAPSGISNLAEFTGEEAEAWLNAQAKQPAPPSFREAVRIVIEQRKQR